MMSIAQITPGLCPITLPVYHSAVFEPGMLAGSNSSGEVDKWEPGNFNRVEGIIDDIKGPSGTSCASGLVTIWPHAMEFNTDMYDPNEIYTPGTCATWGFSQARWIPLRLTASQGSMLSKHVATIVTPPTALAPFLRLNYDPAFYLASVNGATKNIAQVSFPMMPGPWNVGGSGVQTFYGTPKKKVEDCSTNEEAVEEYGCKCIKCGADYQYTPRQENFVCYSCKSYRYMVMGE